MSIFFLFCRLPIFFSSGDLHTSESDPLDHYLVRGFANNGHSYVTLHCRSPENFEMFENGGKKYEENGEIMDLANCKVLHVSP